MNKIINFIYKRIYNPILYAKHIGVKIGNNCILTKDIIWRTEPYLIEIGNNVRITHGVKFITHDGGVWVLRNKYNEKKIDVFGKIRIGNNCNIGINAIIMPGVTIGNNCVVGAGAIVTKNIPDNSVVAGIPAKVIESIEEYYEKVKNKCDYVKDFSPKEKELYLKEKYKLN